MIRAGGQADPLLAFSPLNQNRSLPTSGIRAHTLSTMLYTHLGSPFGTLSHGGGHGGGNDVPTKPPPDSDDDGYEGREKEGYCSRPFSF